MRACQNVRAIVRKEMTNQNSKSETTRNGCEYYGPTLPSLHLSIRFEQESNVLRIFV